MSRQLNPTTVDGILERDGQLLLIRRAHDPFAGQLALPGGFVDYGERVEEAVVRELGEELSVAATPVALLGVYSGPDRDPRGPVITTVFICDFEGQPRAADDAASCEWIAPKQLPEADLAFDHYQILSDYQQWKLESGSFWSSK